MKYSFVPTYYEWDLRDENGNTLLTVGDPSEDLYDENGKPYTYEQTLDFCNDCILCAFNSWEDGDGYNGVEDNRDNIPDPHMNPLDNPDVVAMADALYAYYLK